MKQEGDSFFFSVKGFMGWAAVAAFVLHFGVDLALLYAIVRALW